MPDLGQTHETCGWVELVKLDPNPLLMSFKGKN